MVRCPDCGSNKLRDDVEHGSVCVMCGYRLNQPRKNASSKPKRVQPVPAVLSPTTSVPKPLNDTIKDGMVVYDDNGNPTVQIVSEYTIPTLPEDKRPNLELNEAYLEFYKFLLKDIRKAEVRWGNKQLKDEGWVRSPAKEKYNGHEYYVYWPREDE